jgi:serine/threonine protein kinase
MSASDDSNLSANQRRFLGNLTKAAAAIVGGASPRSSTGMRPKVEDRASGMDLLLGFSMRKDEGKFAPFLIPPDIVSLEHKPFAKNAGGEIVKGKFMGTVVAAKSIFSSLSDDDAETFFHEVEVLTSLAHSNIVHLHGLSVTGNGKALCMVMDYCGGGDLRHFLTSAQFTLSEFNRVTYEILSGVKYLHDKGVAHRDLKPENVLLAKGTHTIKITDFGLSKARSDVLSKGAGTAAYMAPESFIRETEADKKKKDRSRNAYGIAKSDLALDVYSVSVLVWELWFKQRAFAGQDTDAVITHVMKGLRLPLKSTREGQIAPPKSLAKFIEACWLHAAEKRPPIGKALELFRNKVAPEVKQVMDEMERAAAADAAEFGGTGTFLPEGAIRLDAQAFTSRNGSAVFKGKISAGARESLDLRTGVESVCAHAVYVRLANKGLLMFGAEVAALARLSHVNLCAVVGAAQTPDPAVLHLIAEHPAGSCTLASYLKKPAYTLFEFNRIFTQMLGAVAFLHEHGVSRRCLRADTALLTKGGRDVKLSEFGFAEVSKQAATKDDVPPVYMAPEVLDEELAKGAPVDLFKVDMYACAVLLWELWFKQDPFKGMPATRVIQHVTRGKRLPIMGGPGIPAPPSDYKDLVATLWRPDPGTRPTAKAALATFTDEVFPEVAKMPGGGAAPESGDDDDAEDEEEAKAPDDVAVAVPAKAASMDVETRSFLRKAGLEKYERLFVDFGFTDMEILMDRELLDDSTLARDVKMSKLDIRRFRAVLEKDGAVTAAKARRMAAKDGRDPKAAWGAAKQAKDDELRKGKGEQSAFDEPADSLDGGRAAAERAKNGQTNDRRASFSIAAPSPLEEAEKSMLFAALKKAGLAKCMGLLLQANVRSRAAIAALEDEALLKLLDLSRMDLRKLRAVVPFAVMATPVAPAPSPPAGTLAVRVEQAKLAGVLQEAGMKHLVPDLEKAGVKSTKQAADKDDAWLAGTLKLTKLDILRLRAALGGSAAPRAEDDEADGGDLDARLGQSPEARGAVKAAAGDAPNAGVFKEKAQLVSALKQAGLERCMPALFEHGTLTLGALCDLEDAWLVEMLALSRMDLRKLRAIAPSATTSVLDAHVLGTSI